MTPASDKRQAGESVVLAALTPSGTLLAIAERSIDSGGTWKSPNPGDASRKYRYHHAGSLLRAFHLTENAMEPVSHGIIFWLIIGGIAGALAGRIVDGGGFGIVVDIIVGIVGAFIGGWLGGVLGLHLGGGIIGSLITALIGAVILLFIVRLFSRGRTV
jgi:uncharacterized membrane protein YeaQ/YmgE (transglycosylase-associated protein family)